MFNTPSASLASKSGTSMFQEYILLCDMLEGYVKPIAWSHFVWNIVRLCYFYSCYEEELTCPVLFRPYSVLVWDTIISCVLCGALLHGIESQKVHVAFGWVGHTIFSVFLNLIVNNMFDGSWAIIPLIFAYVTEASIISFVMARRIYIKYK